MTITPGEATQYVMTNGAPVLADNTTQDTAAAAALTAQATALAAIAAAQAADAVALVSDPPALVAGG